MTEPDQRDKYMLQIRSCDGLWQCLIQRRLEGFTLYGGTPGRTIWASPLVATDVRAFAEGSKTLRRMARLDRMTAKKKENK